MQELNFPVYRNLTIKQHRKAEQSHQFLLLQQLLIRTLDNLNVFGFGYEAIPFQKEFGIRF